jgi:hypothetical protein
MVRLKPHGADHRKATALPSRLLTAPVGFPRVRRGFRLLGTDGCRRVPGAEAQCGCVPGRGPEGLVGAATTPRASALQFGASCGNGCAGLSLSIRADPRRGGGTVGMNGQDQAGIPRSGCLPRADGAGRGGAPQWLDGKMPGSDTNAPQDRDEERASRVRRRIRHALPQSPTRRSAPRPKAGAPEPARAAETGHTQALRDTAGFR